MSIDHSTAVLVQNSNHNMEYIKTVPRSNKVSEQVVLLEDGDSFLHVCREHWSNIGPHTASNDTRH